MLPEHQRIRALTRRHFLRNCQAGLGSLALGQLLGGQSSAAPSSGKSTLAVKLPPKLAKAKHVIYMHMAGSPPQHELFDYKPKLVEFNMQPCPDSLLKNQRFAFIKGRPKLLGTPYKFSPQGECGTQMSELLPHLGKCADDIAVIKSMYTDQFNHAPAQLFLYTGSPRFGGASMGSWATYGLGSENQNLPGFVVLLTGGSDPSGGKSLWGSGYLPSVYQGVQCRTSGDPILYMSNPAGISRPVRRRSLDALQKLNQREHEQYGDPETLTRIEQYELAFRMQMAAPDAFDLRQESKKTLEQYGAVTGQTSFANNCLLARRLVERGVRYVQLFHYGWDFHGTSKGNDIVYGLPPRVKEVDQPMAALVKDLKQRGLLDETLIIWSGEFGRTSMNEERNGSKFLGRDHHPHCFSIWMAGGGIKGGLSYGDTDELGYFITENKMGVPDLQATMLHLLGFDPKALSYPFLGLDARLIGPTDDAKIQHGLLA